MEEITALNKKAKKKLTLTEKLNMLRAGVLGSNDGILTVAGVAFGVAAAHQSNFAIFIAGLSDLLACAFSMASGEYVSVSTQRDTEKTTVRQQSELLKNDLQSELTKLQQHYEDEGLSETTAENIAEDLMATAPLQSTIRAKYGIELGHYLNPWAAAFSSLIAAGVGGLFPLVSITFLPASVKIWGTVVVVLFALALTGFTSATLGNAKRTPAMIRNVISGALTMLVTYFIGSLFA